MSKDERSQKEILMDDFFEKKLPDGWDAVIILVNPKEKDAAIGSTMDDEPTKRLLQTTLNKMSNRN